MKKGVLTFKFQAIENRNDLLNIPIKSDNESVIRLKDVADVRDTFRERRLVTQEIMVKMRLF